MSEKDQANFEACLDAIGKINIFTQGIEDADQFYDAEMVFDATLMNFVVIGEVMSKISQPTQEKYSKIAWPQIKSFRNIVAHNYFGIDAEEVWQIIRNHIPNLEKQVQRILAENS